MVVGRQMVLKEGMDQSRAGTFSGRGSLRKWYGLCRGWKRLRTSVQENRGINGTAIFVFMIWRYVAFDICSVLRYLGWDSEYFKLAYNVLRREMCISVAIELFDLGYRYLHINIIMFKVEFSLMWQEIKKKNIEARNCKDYRIPSLTNLSLQWDWVGNLSENFILV